MHFLCLKPLMRLKCADKNDLSSIAIANGSDSILLPLIRQ